MDLDFLTVSPALKTIAFIATTPLLILVTWVKFKNGNLSLSQGRTQRLYDLMQGQPNWDEISSGALELAVKGAVSVDLCGDEIRLAMRRDKPLAVLQAMKLTRRLAKLAPDRLNLEDARKNPKLSFETGFKVLASLMIVVYCAVAIAAYVVGSAHHLLVGYLFGFELVVAPFLLVNATKCLAAHCLLSPDHYPLPLAARDRPPIERAAPLMTIVANERD